MDLTDLTDFILSIFFFILLIAVVSAVASSGIIVFGISGNTLTIIAGFGVGWLFGGNLSKIFNRN